MQINLNLWIFILILITCFAAGFLVCFLWIKWQMKKIEKAMKNPRGLEKFIKDPKIRKQMEELRKRFGKNS